LIVVLFQSAWVSVVDTTHFGIELIRSANSPLREGPASANPS
jgi:hypothetical protein